MENLELEERLAFIEFRQQLLFENTRTSRLLFEYEVTQEQYRAIMDIMQDHRDKISRNETISQHGFEQAIYEVIPRLRGNYNFAEGITRTLHEEGRWAEIFETLYESRV
ncbi:DUF1878 domain-containing protein [Bacillus toyonensis]|uniref:DUF1878 domain-containing protein n=1 Tax=Bacillus toyonensis TaxID=155322 RepID=UPI000BEC1DE2|nr:DUF1878 domain-containing protein [Bacillus toyonensis]PDZ33722.1 DUF1878 domain-containing protein [Bacillus toyonensis]PEI55379.1 DUF1878 domain-containing protein [Bacillus toyonensis]PEJ12852.1 DUF1878 domain-containing protein [Bacillus toyonensis]PGE75295.1 DUF1878 domain-containing protein [Bacillus toyonensis]